MTKSFVITLLDNEMSKTCAKNLQESASFDIEIFPAIIPDQVDEMMTKYGIQWNYPWTGHQLDIATGLIKTAYATKYPKKRVACFLSHYTLWKKCVQLSESFIIFEHDAIVNREIPFDDLEKSKYTVIGLNHPIGATRRAEKFYSEVLKSNESIVPVPKIDNDQIPQGLAGNSAYYIKPAGAQKLIDLVNQYGAFPNDAIMCRQLMPNQLAVIKPFCTKLQKVPSTTTL